MDGIQAAQIYQIFFSHPPPVDPDTNLSVSIPNNIVLWARDLLAQVILFGYTVLPWPNLLLRRQARYISISLANSPGTSMLLQ